MLNLFNTHIRPIQCTTKVHGLDLLHVNKFHKFLKNLHGTRPKPNPQVQAQSMSPPISTTQSVHQFLPLTHVAIQAKSATRASTWFVRHATCVPRPKRYQCTTRPMEPRAIRMFGISSKTQSMGVTRAFSVGIQPRHTTHAYPSCTYFAHLT